MRIDLRSASVSVIAVTVLSVALAEPAAALGLAQTSWSSSTSDIVPNGELTEEQAKQLLMPSTPFPDVAPQMPVGDYSSSNPVPPVVPAVITPWTMPVTTYDFPGLSASGSGGGGTAAGAPAATAQTPAGVALAAQRVRAFRTARVLAGPVPSTWAGASIRGLSSRDQRAGESVVRDPLLDRPH